LFYRTLDGAQVGDLFMSLNHTCQLCGVTSFDYLFELQHRAKELAARPAGVMMNPTWPKRIPCSYAEGAS